MACAPLLNQEDLSRFRTKQCLRILKGHCEFGDDRCQYNHNHQWIRRSPFSRLYPSYIKYIPVMCPDIVIPNSNLLDICACKRGRNCPFAHSLDEILYHPLTYKTIPCDNYVFKECSVYYCPFYHRKSEKRNPESFKLLLLNTYNGPEIPNLKDLVVVHHNPKLGEYQNESCSSNEEFNFDLASPGIDSLCKDRINTPSDTQHWKNLAFTKVNNQLKDSSGSTKYHQIDHFNEPLLGNDALQTSNWDRQPQYISDIIIDLLDENRPPSLEDEKSFYNCCASKHLEHKNFDKSFDNSFNFQSFLLSLQNDSIRSPDRSTYSDFIDSYEQTNCSNSLTFDNVDQKSQIRNLDQIQLTEQFSAPLSVSENDNASSKICINVLYKILNIIQKLSGLQSIKINHVNMLIKIHEELKGLLESFDVKRNQDITGEYEVNKINVSKLSYINESCSPFGFEEIKTTF